MSIFGDLMDRIRGHEARKSEAKVNAAVAANAPAAATPSVNTPAATSSAPVDIEAVLTDMASGNSQKLDWKHSIVDLMKLVGMDSGLEQRKALAKELGYTEDTSDSAAMNIWLHKQVMKKMAENGGKVPADLLS
jgi:hypothetical protein